MSGLLIMKFGGTSVGSAERMRAACDLISSEAVSRPVVAVVSAMSKITDLLLDTTRHAEAGDRNGLEANLMRLEARHKEAAAGLGLALDSQIDELVGEFRRIVEGIQMLGHRPPRNHRRSGGRGRAAFRVAGERTSEIARARCGGSEFGGTGGDRRGLQQRFSADGGNRSEGEGPAFPFARYYHRYRF